MEAKDVSSAGDDAALEPSRPRTFIKDIVRGATEELVGRKVVVGGWVKTGREQGKGSFAFLELNDGSCLANLQVIVDAAVHPLTQLVPTGTCVLVEGELKKPPEGAKQNVELKVESVLEVGPVDPAKYPLPKTRLTLEFLRDFGHLRARTNTCGGSKYDYSKTTAKRSWEPRGALQLEQKVEDSTKARRYNISAVARIRDELAYATHTFFRKNGFRYVHTPIITTSDCEGAGEMFQVTTLFSDAEKVEKELKQNPRPSESDIEAAKLLVKEKGETVSQLKSSKASKQEISASVSELTKAKESLSRLEERFKLKAGIPQKDGKIDYAHDFFGRQAFLTVSGQLQVETYACALGNVYTFGPTFRAEHSHTSRHLAEFWMVEPEIAFANLEVLHVEIVDDMNYAESYVKFLCKWLLDNCLEDMEFMVKNFDKAAIERLKLVSSSPFERISYTKAVQLLKNVTDKKFENEVEWGIDLASEHERSLEIILMLLFPAFFCRITDSGLPLEPYEWYLDLRRFGTVKHSGFGLGFERMILFATGIDNIRDVIPFPRYPGRADL
ncbi:hypothetical protein GW17_00023735 [Ensete ventricosum]|nr:hypothetical protein GW17_00023735 [Ensete ventricosum]